MQQWRFKLDYLLRFLFCLHHTIVHFQISNSNSNIHFRHQHTYMCLWGLNHITGFATQGSICNPCIRESVLERKYKYFPFVNMSCKQRHELYSNFLLSRLTKSVPYSRLPLVCQTVIMDVQYIMCVLQTAPWRQPSHLSGASTSAKPWHSIFQVHQIPSQRGLYVECVYQPEPKATCRRHRNPAKCV